MRRANTAGNLKLKGQIVIKSTLSIITMGFGLMTAAMYAATIDQPANATFGTQQPNAAVFTFVSQSEPITDTGALSSQACVEYNRNAQTKVKQATSDAGSPKNLALDSGTLDAISNELQKKLAEQKMSVTLNPDTSSIPVGGLVVSACIVSADKGSATKRIIGLGWGASRLGAHVVLLSKTTAGFTTLGSFDLEVKGRSFTPPTPVTVAAHAAMAGTQTLSADGKKLADQIAKKLDRYIKGLVVKEGSMHQ